MLISSVGVDPRDWLPPSAANMLMSPAADSPQPPEGVGGGLGEIGAVGLECPVKTLDTRLVNAPPPPQAPLKCRSGGAAYHPGRRGGGATYTTHFISLSARRPTESTEPIEADFIDQSAASISIQVDGATALYSSTLTPMFQHLSLVSTMSLFLGREKR